MKNRLSSIMLSFVFVVILTTKCFAGTIEILTFEYPPLIKADQTGMLQQIINKAAINQGKKVKFIIRPRKRAMKMFKNMNNKLFLGESRYFPNMLPDIKAWKLMYLRVVLVYLKKNYPLLNLTKIENLKKKNLGVSLGSNVTPIFIKAGWHVEETSQLESNLRKLKRGRIDFWGTVGLTAVTLIKKIFPGQLNSFGMWELEKFSVELIAKKNTPADKMLEKLCIGFENIIQNGQYKKTFEEVYGKGRVPASVMVK